MNLSELTRVLGEDGVKQLIAAKGGQKIYVPHPARLRPDDPLLCLLGEPYRALAQLIGGDAVKVPKYWHGQRRQMIHAQRAAVQALQQSGVPVTTICAQVHRCRSQVYRYLREEK